MEKGIDDDGSTRFAGYVAENTRRIRHEKGWPLSRLSMELEARGHRLGVAALSKLENGDRGVSIDDVVAIAAAFGVPTTRLIREPSVASDELVSETLDHLGVELDSIEERWGRAVAEMHRIDTEQRDLSRWLAQRCRALGDDPTDWSPLLDRVAVRSKPVADEARRILLGGDS